jgi:protein-disulfide isomerase
MLLTRRFTLAAATALLAGPALADDADPRLTPRSVGPDDAKNQVEEWFSFTCPHCAAFAAEDYPQIRAKLVDTGRVHYVFREFARNKVDVTAGLVARSLPASRYEPFVLALFSSQKQWAFNNDADPTEELAKMAALAGMPRDAFDRAINDQALQQAMIKAQTEAEEKYNIDSTPTFIINRTAHAGELTYDQFVALLQP